MDEKILLDQFRQMDKDGNGTLSKREIRHCMKLSGFNEAFLTVSYFISVSTLSHVLYT
ncbi:unnamed protein product [Schistosoma curassoni]|nr:unnamed protein product [Schistosoma curassoni]